MIIAPSLLAADFGRLAKETERVDRSGADCCTSTLWMAISCEHLLGLQCEADSPTDGLFFDVHLCARNANSAGAISLKPGRVR